MDQVFLKFHEASSDGATLSAVLSEVGKADRVGDVLLPGAFDKALDEFKQHGLPLKYMHDKGEIIGKWTDLSLNGDKLVGKASLFTDIQRGEEAVKLFDHGVLKGVSIGFRPRNGLKSMDFNGKGIDFSDVALVEASLVDRPAMPGAEVTELRKSLFEADRPQTPGVLDALTLLLK